jgi:hypothetical protein
MRVPKEQYCAFFLVALVRVIDHTFTRSQADFEEVFAAIYPSSLAIAFYLKSIKSLQFKIIIE